MSCFRGRRRAEGGGRVPSANSVVCRVVPFVSPTVVAHSPRHATVWEAIRDTAILAAESLVECGIDQRKHNSIGGLRSVCLASFDPSQRSVRHDRRESEVAQKTPSEVPSGAKIMAADSGQCVQLRSRSRSLGQVRQLQENQAKTAFSEPGPRIIEE